LKIFGIAFGLGVVSGIVMAFQFGTNWSVLSKMSGPIQGPLLSGIPAAPTRLYASGPPPFRRSSEPRKAATPPIVRARRCRRTRQGMHLVGVNYAAILFQRQRWAKGTTCPGSWWQARQVHAASRRFSPWQTSMSALTSASISASLCSGVGVSLKRSVPRGTVGWLIGCT
jgi:hypothetical protein